MSRSLALLSGKGGSGKTTLALSMVSLLSSCGIKVLLIDCDLSTNGATFFYESRLLGNDEEIISFSDILDGINQNNDLPIKIDEYLDFIPSITKIVKRESREQYYNEKELSNFEDYFNEIRHQYDIILFDCQAGYTGLLDIILKLSDINLIVMEADAISSASIRTLYLKIADIIGHRKVYQLFNKATQEEYDIYSKISGGTFFTNIATIIFDWRIRKAFSVAQVPDMEKTSYKYGEEIYDLCKILFSEVEYQERLHKFRVKLKLHEIEEKEKKLQKLIEELGEKRRQEKRKMIRKGYSSLTPAIAIILLMVVWRALTINNYLVEYYDIVIPIVTGILCLFTLFISLINRTKEQKLELKEYYIVRRELEELTFEKNKLQAVIKENHLKRK